MPTAPTGRRLSPRAVIRQAAKRIQAIQANPFPLRHPDPRPFGLDWVRRFLPHYLKNEPSRLRLDLAADLRDLHVRRGQKRNYIAPRGAVKTTWVSKAYPL